MCYRTARPLGESSIEIQSKNEMRSSNMINQMHLSLRFLSIQAYLVAKTPVLYLPPLIWLVSRVECQSILSIYVRNEHKAPGSACHRFQ